MQLPHAQTRPLFSLLLAAVFTGSRFLLGLPGLSEPAHGIAALLLDAVWCIPCVIRLRQNRAHLMVHRSPRLLLSAGLLLLFFGILQVLRLLIQVEDPVNLSLSFREMLILLDVVLLSPLLEEWVFRGEGYLTLRRAMPDGCALLVSSLLFAAGHLDQGIPVSALVFGILAVLLLKASSSLLFPILLHGLLNAVSFLPPMPLRGCAVTILAGLGLICFSWKRDDFQAR